MERTKDHFHKYWPLYCFLFFYIGIFYKVFFFGLLPFPGDLLVAWFFPYKSGGWEGYSEWVTHKEFIAADVVRQLYPWRDLAMEMIKNGEMPLWNPYAFSGTPLMANLQTAALYPFNILFFLFSSQTAWNIYILLQPILAFIFMFLFLRSLQLSRISSVVAGCMFGFIGYMVVWFEHGVVGHSALWLPLCLWGVNTFNKKKEIKYVLITSLGMAFSLFAGHAQTSSYVIALTLIYTVSTIKSSLMYRFRVVIITALLAVGLSAIQIIPSVELMLHSARNADTSAEILKNFQMPLIHLVTLFASDIFGNPAVNNYWGKDYAEFIVFSGIVALVLAVYGLTYKDKKNVLFFSITGFVSILFATVLAPIILNSRIPVLSTGIPTRILFLFQFSLIVFAGFGVEQFLKGKISFRPGLILLGIYGLIGALVLSGFTFFADQPDFALNTAKRNLLLPGVTALVSVFLLIVFRGKKRFRYAVIVLLMFLAVFEYQYFVNKYLPFSPRNYVFPQHNFVDYLSTKTPPNRVYGYDTARIDPNLFVEWRVLSPEGYDPLYIKRYGELLFTAEKKQYSEKIHRSDAVLTVNPANEDDYQKQVIMNLTGVKYAVDKDDSAPEKWDPRSNVFTLGRFNLLYQHYKWKLYENKESLPRAGIVYDVRVMNDKEKILRTLLADSFNYHQSVILEESPLRQYSSPQEIIPAEIRSYSENKVEIQTVSSKPGILFLSDVYYPGWTAYVDGKKTPILRANYAFRAVEIPKGNHTVEFKYIAYTFYAGLAVSIISLSLWIYLWIKPVKLYEKNK